MAKIEPIPCPRCFGSVSVNASGGGRGTNDLTHYSADCGTCGMLVDHLTVTPAGATVPYVITIAGRARTLRQRQSPRSPSAVAIQSTMVPLHVFPRPRQSYLSHHVR